MCRSDGREEEERKGGQVVSDTVSGIENFCSRTAVKGFKEWAAPIEDVVAEKATVEVRGLPLGRSALMTLVPIVVGHRSEDVRALRSSGCEDGVVSRLLESVTGQRCSLGDVVVLKELVAVCEILACFVCPSVCLPIELGIRNQNDKAQTTTFPTLSPHRPLSTLDT
jgi:hypothetical protein